MSTFSDLIGTAWQKCASGEFFGEGECTCSPRPRGGWTMEISCLVHAKYLVKAGARHG